MWQKILKKAENEVAVLDQITEFLVQKKFEKAKAHWRVDPER